MQRSKTCLPDINVWVAMWWDGHAHHPAAKTWFSTVELSGAAFCRITQMGFLRLITNARLMDEDVVSQKQAWEIYERIVRDPRVLFVPEPEGLETAWKRITQSLSAETNVWTDAYLAAFATVQGLTLVSFDRALAKRQGLDCVLLRTGN